jgi:periplasmic divalent cation tolerance protein
MPEFVVIFVTVGSSSEGAKIAQALVEERLAACVNRMGPVRSIYNWKGKLCKENEELLIIKSRRELFGALEKRVREIHSYEVPEIIALPVAEGSGPYLEWVEKNTMKKEESRS